MSLKIVKGVGTLVWGAGGILSAPAGAIIDSLQLTPKNGAPIEIEGNEGRAAFEVLIVDGFNGKVSLLYDDTKNWPVEGANATLAIPFKGSSANTIPFGVSDATLNPNGAAYANGVVTYTVLIGGGPTLGYNKKKEATISYDVTYRPDVAV